MEIMGPIKVITTTEWAPGIFKKMLGNLRLIRLDEASAKAINEASAQSKKRKNLQKRKK